MGLFWPVPEVGHPGTPRLFEGGRFFHPDGKARFHPIPFRESAEVVDDEYPIWLTTGRVVSQYLSGTQTRRIEALVRQYPEPLCEMHPRLAEQLGVADGDLVTVTSRRGDMTLPARVVATIRPDTVFIPYHWPGRQAANQLTNRALDPLSRMPEFKVAAVRIEKAAGRRETADARDLDLHDGSDADVRTQRRPGVRDRPEPLHRLRGLRAGRAWSAAPTGASRSSTSRPSTAPRPPRPRRRSACTARTRPAPRSARPTPSSRPRAASCSPRSSPAASAAPTA